MRNSLLWCFLLFPSMLHAATRAEQLYAALERRLQALKSLEIRYEATGAAGEAAMTEGKLVWIRPDRFLHDTPEWTLCEDRGEQWRYLKEQNTLIRETAPRDRSAWLPEEMLFNLRKEYRAESLSVSPEGVQVLYLSCATSELPGVAALEFGSGEMRPSGLSFTTYDGERMEYRIVSWLDNPDVDAALFDPPDVPAENTIDFRGAGQGR